MLATGSPCHKCGTPRTIVIDRDSGGNIYKYDLCFPCDRENKKRRKVPKWLNSILEAITGKSFR